MFTRFLKQLTVSLVLTAMATALGSAQQPRRVTVAFRGSESEYNDIWMTAKRAFEATHPGIELELLHIVEDFRPKIVTLAIAGEAPDVWMSNPDEAIDYWNGGLSSDLSPFIARDLEVEVEDFFPASIDSFNVNGVQTGFPTHIQVTSVWYNRNLLDEAGLAAPPEGWTWEDFRLYARRMTERPDGQNAVQWGAVIRPQAEYLHPWLFSAGGSIVDNLNRPTRATIGDPESFAALSFIQALYAEDQVVAGRQPDPFYQGKVGMFPYYAIAQRMSEVDFPYNVASFPAGPAGSVNAMFPGGLVMAAKPQDADAAWKFITYMAKSGAYSYNTIPAYRPFAMTDEWPFVEVPPDYNRQVWVNGAASSKPVAINHPRARDIFSAADKLRDILMGQGALGPAVEQVVAQVNGLLNAR